MRYLFLTVLLLSLVACGDDPIEGPPGGGTDGAPPSSMHPGTEAGAKALLSEFLAPGANHAKLSAVLAPATGDYAAAFVGDAAVQAEAGYKGAWESGRIVLKPNAGQTELLLWKATAEELQTWTGDAKDRFPGGYREAAKHLKPGVTWYRFKFVKPGSTLGMAYDGLVHVNGRWPIFPTPWRVLASGGPAIKRP